MWSVLPAKLSVILGRSIISCVTFQSVLVSDLGLPNDSVSLNYDELVGI